jgi:hypothetical protein
VTQLLFRQGQPSLKDFSFNGRTEKAIRHVLQKLKTDYITNADAPVVAAGNTQPETPKTKRKATAERTGSSTKRAKKATKPVSVEPEDIQNDPNDFDEDYTSD